MDHRVGLELLGRNLVYHLYALTIMSWSKIQNYSLNPYKYRGHL